MADGAYLNRAGADHSGSWAGALCIGGVIVARSKGPSN